MARKRYFVVLAALLLVAQLLFGVISTGAMAHDVARDCDGCPASDSTSVSHEEHSRAGMPGGNHGSAHCGTHCSHGGSPDTGNARCDSGCTMAGSGQCGSHASPAFIATASSDLAELTGSFDGERRSVHLPDSPLFDFLRPPTRA